MLLAVLSDKLRRVASDFCAPVQRVLIFSPDTVLQWHRELVRREWTFRRKSVAARPSITPELEAFEVSIRLRLYHEGEMTVVEVADTRIGIPMEDLPHIFESFYRVDSARSAESGRADLGLPIAKTLVELMNGQIDVESTFGASSVFKIYLPSDPEIASQSGKSAFDLYLA